MSRYPAPTTLTRNFPGTRLLRRETVYLLRWDIGGISSRLWRMSPWQRQPLPGQNNVATGEPLMSSIQFTTAAYSAIRPLPALAAAPRRAPMHREASPCGTRGIPGLGPGRRRRVQWRQQTEKRARCRSRDRTGGTFAPAEPRSRETVPISDPPYRAAPRLGPAWRRDNTTISGDGPMMQYLSG